MSPTPLTVLPDPSKGFQVKHDPKDIAHVAIFPPLGISRVGDSDTECFLAPEVPGRTSPPKELGSKFRDPEQKLRRMAVRFRVYAYNKDGEVIGEINNDNGFALSWSVNVANKKGSNFEFQHSGRFNYPSSTALRNPKVQSDKERDQRTKLIVSARGDISTQYIPGPVSLAGTFQGSANDKLDVQLAQLQLDSAGRLIFIPGKGDARSVADPTVPHQKITSEFDNADWIDEVCDGEVTVRVGTLTGSEEPFDPEFSNYNTLSARVLSAPTKFSWGVHQPTNLHDIMEDIYRKANHPLVPPPDKTNLDFWVQIWPSLHAAASMAWANNSAFQGHGPFGTGNFNADALFKLFDSSNTDPAMRLRRKHFKHRVFEKLRHPLDDNNIDETQANVRYMPLLSGDAGDMPDPGTFPGTNGDLKPDARRFAALTNLQYDRFRVWAEDDDFVLHNNLPVPPEKLEDIDLCDQPKNLTLAILEFTIGDPLFPGIETYWIAKVPSTYAIDPKSPVNPPFRFASSDPETDNFQVGYLTRGLSLPWQCDFDLCEVHWWPSARPDDVTTRIAFEGTVQKSQDKNYFDTAVTSPVKWTRGLRESVAYSRDQPDWFGSDDMLRYWTYLGVLREVPDAFTDGATGEKYTVYLEDERVFV